MEYQYLSFPTTIVIITAVSLIALILGLQILKKKNNNNSRRKAPEAKGAWPLIGHLHLLGGSELPHKVLGAMADKYGPIFTIKLGVHRALVVSDADIAKECFTTNDKAFASRSKTMASELMGYNNAMLGFAQHGPYWQQVRKIIMIELLSKPCLEMFAHIRVSEVRNSIKSIYDTWANNKESNDLDTIRVEMKEWFSNTVLNTVVRMISGKQVSSNDQERLRCQDVARKFFELAGVFVVSDALPYLKFLDLGGYEKAMKRTRKEMDSIFEGWLEEHKRRPMSKGQQGFMDVMISDLQTSSQEDFPGFDHDTIVKATCLNILIAGTDTTTVTLTWALSLLLNNPKALKIAQDELDVHVGRERLVEDSDLENLVYLQAIFKETMRLYPAGPLLVPHESMMDCVLAGYNIPKGTRLIVNAWKIHHDTIHWSDPYEFRPERFLTNQKDIDVKGKHFELIPFGSGRRICPGISFALPSLHLTMASLIQGFELAKPSNEPIDMNEILGLSIMKETPLDILLTPRLSHDIYNVVA